MVEIHIRQQNTREIYQQNLQEVWRDVVPVILNGVETLRQELSDMLIHACLHLDKHFVTSHVQFTSFNDIVNLIRMIEDGQLTTPSPHPQLLSLRRGEQETANPKQTANITESIKENIQNQIHQKILNNSTDTIQFCGCGVSVFGYGAVLLWCSQKRYCYAYLTFKAVEEPG